MELPSLSSDEKLLGIDIKLRSNVQIEAILLEDKLRFLYVQSFKTTTYPPKTFLSSFVRRNLLENRMKQSGKGIFTPKKFLDISSVYKEYFISFR